MTKKIIWLIISCLMALSLVMASCGPAAEEEEEEEEEEVVVEEEEEEKEVVVEEEEEEVTGPEEPKYGGVLNTVLTSDIRGFDEVYTIHYAAPTIHLTNEELLTGDWVKGPAGTGQTDWTVQANRYDLKTGSLAESWELPEDGHFIFHIRKGVHYGLNPDSEASRLVNGRELTADDVVFSLHQYLYEPDAWYFRMIFPGMCSTVKVTAPDKWTVDIQCPPEYFIRAAFLLPDFSSIVPPEVSQKYGDMRDWRVSVGTGPFFLTDFVPGSTATFIRNPNYWGKDPIAPGKGNQLPYLDGVKMLIIPDISTQLAALRTGKLDVSAGRVINRDDATSLMQTTPELKHLQYIPSSGRAIYMRTDKAELPFSDKRVRRALMMATDLNEIANAIHGGEAQINVFPIPKVPGYEDAYLPLEEAPESVKELYVYNPEKAKQLLTEAGYPDGFETKILCSASGGIDPDYLSIIKDMWAKVDVDLKIEPLEVGPYTSIFNRRQHEEMIYAGIGNISPYVMGIYYSGTMGQNASCVNDPYVAEVQAEIFKYYCKFDYAKIAELHRELCKYILDEAWALPQPLGYNYTFWWPWLKKYHGEQGCGFDNGYVWSKFIWIDRDLKAEMVAGR